MSTQAQQGPAGQGPALAVYEHIDALALAFDRVKAYEAYQVDGGDAEREHAYHLAQLWTGLATALELRLLRREQAARDAAWRAREDAWLVPYVQEEGEG